MTDQLETLEDSVAAIPDTTITKGDVSLSWDGLEYTYRAFGREIDRDEALALLRALETEENHGGSRLFRLAASTQKAEGVIYAKRVGDRVWWFRHMDIMNRMDFYTKAEASLFTIEEVKAEIDYVNRLPSRWIAAVWPELASPDPIAIAPEGAKAIVTDPKLSEPYRKPIHPMTPADTFAAGPKPIKDLGPDPSAAFLAAKDYAEPDLYKAAKNYAFRVTPDGLEQYALSLAFRAGAEWQAARITDAIEEAIK